MAYYIVDSSCGGVSITNYSCNPCITKEHGRIRKIAVIKNSYLATVMVAPTLNATWTTMLSTGNGWLYSDVQGSYDGGSTTEEAGFGDQSITNGNTTHTLVVKDPNYLNCDHWNALRNSSDYTVAYVTENYVHFAGAVATITPKNPVTDDINAIVTWEIQFKWVNADSPCPYSRPTTAFEACTVAS